MKINFPFVKTKKIHRITRAKVHEYINPIREWSLGLLGATAVLLVGATYIGIDLHEQFTNEPAFVEVDETTLTYNRTGVMEKATLFREKDAHFNELRATQQMVTAPIIPDVPIEMVPIIQESQASTSDSFILQ